MTASRKICVVTGSRAEYGLMRSLLGAISTDPALTLQIVATGMHLSPEFGMTYRSIEEDGFHIDAKVEMLLSADSAVAVTKSLGLGVIGFADAFERLAPDIVVALGDRFEILAAAQAAMLACIPIAHIHGGETSEGAFDEGIRHAITKMAQWHFVAAEPYRRRVVQLGEAPDRVFNVGAPGLDILATAKWMGRDELATSLDMELGEPLFMVTYHPVTLESRSPRDAMMQLLGALEAFPQATIVFTYPNADTGGRVLIDCIDQFVVRNRSRAKAFVSLGQLRYLSLMREANVVIGNSSSGLTEAPAMKRATVNIGNRQNGRLKASSVIDATDDQASIIDAIKQALSAEFVSRLPATYSLYGHGDAAAAIVSILRSATLSVQKAFFDIAHEY
ncbi:UDP-N-acetylglucosamine 2-epimerase [Achromobacter xylosoxidans]|uniref:UDP-N-acetylglucosamine 2-epimerase n=1 Tax=Alcaligenes xylosoxydans xylosoxydans TaxID=85698 RepID=UPI001EEF74CB|nr:UDP-N-acetylglucosamine 2-epimerase [Achromobacter xylosoxidans]MEC6408910.1 UDP-N-acetylglucosamine 2-epimerase [Achromobacter xylosoxidans]